MASSTLADLQIELANVQDAKTSALKTGAKFSMTGSYGATSVSYRELCKRETHLKNKIAAMQGYHNHTIMDFS